MSDGVGWCASGQRQPAGSASGSFLASHAGDRRASIHGDRRASPEAG